MKDKRARIIEDFCDRARLGVLVTIASGDTLPHVPRDEYLAVYNSREHDTQSRLDLIQHVNMHTSICDRSIVWEFCIQMDVLDIIKKVRALDKYVYKMTSMLDDAIGEKWVNESILKFTSQFSSACESEA